MMSFAHARLGWIVLPSPKRTRILSLVVLCWMITSSGWAQQRPRPKRLDPRAFDPSVLLESFFGAESAADKERAERIQVSYREEQQVGQSAFNAFRKQLEQRDVSLLDRGKDVDYLRSLVSRLRPRMKHAKRYRRIRVYLADSEDTDARSFPGGTVVVFRGLIDFCQSEAALVGILGHELSHFDRGHQLYHVKRWKLMQQSFQQGFNPNTFSRMGGSFMKMFTRPFRPEEETEADDDGANWAFALGYDPEPMAHVFRRLSERDGNRAERMPRFMRSHPFHSDRYRAILNRANELRAKSDRRLYVGVKNLARRLPRSERAYEDEYIP